MNIAPNKAIIRQDFDSTAEARYLVAREIESRLVQTLSSLVSVPTVKIRAKKFDSYYKKYRSLLKSGNTDPRITDLMGLRIVCPFLEDMATAEELIKENFNVIEAEYNKHNNFKDFCYESVHLLIKIPSDIAQKYNETGCDVAEIQIRTILQDAWAEVEHELIYKAEFYPIDEPMKRKLYAVNASLALADTIFQEIRSYQNQLNGQLGKRRDAFYRKIKDVIDARLFSSDEPGISLHMGNEVTGYCHTPEEDSPQVISVDPDNNSIDDLLLIALTAHNENRFEDAINVYSRILGLNPKVEVCSLIYKHRGMLYFTQSMYPEAIADFTNALELDDTLYKIAYYRGVVYSVLGQYPEAIDDFNKSLKINPYQEYCLFRRGQAYYHVGDFPQALSDCEAAISLEPDNENMKDFRELIQKELKM